MQCAIVSMSGQITFDNSVWDLLNNVVKVVLIRIDYLYSVYCDHVGTLSIVYLVRKSEFVLQYLRDEGENE